MLIFEAIRNGDTQRVHSLLKENPSLVNIKDARGFYSSIVIYLLWTYLIL